MTPDYDQIDRDAFADWRDARDLEREPMAIALSNIRRRKERGRAALDRLKLTLMRKDP